MSVVRLCRHCKEIKPDADFSAAKRSKTKATGVCKACDAVRARRHYADNTAKYLATKRVYSKENAEKIKAASRAWRAKNPDKWRAQKRPSKSPNSRVCP